MPRDRVFDECGSGVGAPQPAEPEAWPVMVPEHCEVFLPVRHRDVIDWDRWLSFAACLQDASVMRVGEPADVASMVEQLSYGIGPAMRLYREALTRAPRTIQVRAAFYAGSAALALVVRARSSLVARDLEHHRRLRESLEPLLAPSKQMAWLVFAAVVRAASEDPSLAHARSFVRSSARTTNQARRSRARNPCTDPDGDRRTCVRCIRQHTHRHGSRLAASITTMPRLLLADHHRQIEDACRALLARTYGDDSRALIAEYRGFERAMLEHFAAEEEEILPGYAEHAPDDAQTIRDAHARFRQLLFRLGVEVELHLIRVTTVNELIDQLHAHAIHEDGAMYPWAEAQLSVTAKRRLFVRIARSLRALASRSADVAPPTKQPPAHTQL